MMMMFKHGSEWHVASSRTGQLGNGYALTAAHNNNDNFHSRRRVAGVGRLCKTMEEESDRKIPGKAMDSRLKYSWRKVEAAA